jgi:hypothetical protein
VNEQSSEIAIQHDVLETTYYNGILFHGSKKPFQFRAEYNYDVDVSDTDGSWTLGPGLYMLDDLEGAKDYSSVRQSKESTESYVYSVSAPNCKFLDFRGEQGENVPVPKSMIHAWAEFFGIELEKEIVQNPTVGNIYETYVDASGTTRRRLNLAAVSRDTKQKYAQFLRELDKQGTEDLRYMLGTEPVVDSESGFTGNFTGPEWGKLFSEFVTKKLGYDGIIYIERSEKNEAFTQATYVVYNLDSIQVSQEPITK